MGMSFSTIQIQNRNHLDSVQFEKKLANHMKKRGFVPTTSDNSQLSYTFILSENKDWITLVSDTSHEDMTDAQALAKAMKTVCIVTSVHDSDFAAFHCYNTIGKAADFISLGFCEEETECNNERKPPNVKFWQSLLLEGRTFDELQEMWGEEYIFQEEVFAKVAPLLGMDARNICMDFIHNESNNAITVYYKNEEPLFFTEGVTKLHTYVCSGILSGEPNYFAFINVGGISKGLAIVVLGECFKNGEVKIGDEIKVERHKYPIEDYNGYKSRGFGNDGNEDELEIFTSQWEEYNIPDGRSGFIAYFNDFEFFHGLNLEHPSLKGRKRQDLTDFHGIIVWHSATIVSGDKHKLYAFAIPINNWEAGQTSVSMELQERAKWELEAFGYTRVQSQEESCESE